MSNEAIASMSQQIRQRDERITKEEAHSRELSEQIGQNWMVVDKATDLVDQSIEVGKQAAKEEIQTLSDDFVEMINLVLTSLGLSQERLQQNLNMVDIGNGKQGVDLTRSQIAQFAEIYRKAMQPTRKQTL